MAKIITDEKLIEKLLERGTDEIIEKEHLKKRLFRGEKLRVKLGIDPTSPDLHLGHTVPLRKLRQFQDLGHQAILIIGDFTALIGDPSGKNEMRKMLTKKEIGENLRDYQEQAKKVLDMSKVEVRFNSEWFEKMGSSFLFELASKFTVARVLERDDFRKRIKENIDVSIMEIMYPLMQGYDSVALKADVEIGGTDQKFNLLMGRKVQRRYNQEEQDVVTVPLLEGTDGVQKMSKSLGNYIGLSEKPNDVFCKIMSISDILILKYMKILTDISEEEIENMQDETKTKFIDPREAKLKLAYEIVKMYHSKELAENAKEYFVKTFSKKETPDDVQVVPSSAPSISVIDYLIEAGLAKSKSDARRKIEQGGVELNGEKINDPKKILDSEKDDGKVLKVGKKDFVKIKFE
jgi:tyrosyl-tRNA synthetase